LGEMRRSKIKLGIGYTFDSNTGLYTCDICGKISKNDGEAMMHFTWDHPVENAWLQLLSTRSNLEHYCLELCPYSEEWEKCPEDCAVDKLIVKLNEFISSFETWVRGKSHE